MSTLFTHYPSVHEEGGNVTVRRGRDPPRLLLTLGDSLIDSILTHDETKDIVSMMIIADELGDNSSLHSFCTLTQMGGRNPTIRPVNPLLSPLGLQGHGVTRGSTLEYIETCDKNSTNAQLDWLCKTPISVQDRNLINFRDKLSECVAFDGEGSATAREAIGDVLHVAEVASDPDPLIGEAGDGPVGMVEGERSEASMASNLDTARDAVKADVTKGEEGGAAADGGADEGCDYKGSEPANMAAILDKMCMVEESLTRIGERSAGFDKSVGDLHLSLELSQNEIDLLRKENTDLKRKLGNFDMEDKCTQFQVSVLEEKVPCKHNHILLMF